MSDSLRKSFATPLLTCVKSYTTFIRENVGPLSLLHTWIQSPTELPNEYPLNMNM